MRPFHITGLRPAPGTFDVFGELGTLMVPSLVRDDRQGDVIAFWHAGIGDGRLPLLEVDWSTGLRPASLRLLDGARATFGAAGLAVVVRVDRPGVDLLAVRDVAELRPFRHVAIRAALPARNARTRYLAVLAAEARRMALARYRDLSKPLSLAAGAPDRVRALLDVLVDPAEVVEVVGSLVEVQLDGLREADWEVAAVRQCLVRQMERRPPEQLVALLALAARRPVADRTALLGEEDGAVLDELTEQLVVVGGVLNGWAARLLDARVTEGLFGSKGALPRREQVLDGWRERLETAVEWVSPRAATVEGPGADEPGGPRPPRARLYEVFSLIAEGELGQARELLDGLVPTLDDPGTALSWKGDFQDAVGRLRVREGRWPEAERAFREATGLLEAGGASPRSRAITLHVLACGLRDNGRWPEAEPLFREAIRLNDEGGARGTIRAITLHELARGLRDNGRWPEAEPLFREAIRLLQEGRASPTSRAITLQELARGLRDNGRWPEAEPLFREAIRLKEEGSASPTSRAITLGELARGLRDNGCWPEAEPLFREAIRLTEEGGASPTSRAITLDQYARGLRDNGRWPEAEPLFREAIRLKEEGGDSATSRAITLEACAAGLQQRGCLEEAAGLLEQAQQLRGSEQGALEEAAPSANEDIN